MPIQKNVSHLFRCIMLTGSPCTAAHRLRIITPVFPGRQGLRLVNPLEGDQELRLRHELVRRGAVVDRHLDPAGRRGCRPLLVLLAACCWREDHLGGVGVVGVAGRLGDEESGGHGHGSLQLLEGTEGGCEGRSPLQPDRWSAYGIPAAVSRCSILVSLARIPVLAWVMAPSMVVSRARSAVMALVVAVDRPVMFACRATSACPRVLASPLIPAVASVRSWAIAAPASVRTLAIAVSVDAASSWIA